MHILFLSVCAEFGFCFLTLPFFVQPVSIEQRADSKAQQNYFLLLNLQLPVLLLSFLRIPLLQSEQNCGCY